MVGESDDVFVQAYEDDLELLAKAVAASNAEQVASSGRALFARVLTGSSVATCAAEKAAAKAFGQWLADISDVQRQEAARTVHTSPKVPELSDFASLVEPLVAFALHAFHAAIIDSESFQIQSENLLTASVNDFGALLRQSLRPAALLELDQADRNALLQRVGRALNS
jgi:hypothetical protein